MAVVVTVDNDENELFAFTCTSDYVAVTNTLDVPKSKLKTCMDSGVSHDYWRLLHSPTYSGGILVRILDSNWNFQNPVFVFWL